MGAPMKTNKQTKKFYMNNIMQGIKQNRFRKKRASVTIKDRMSLKIKRLFKEHLSARHKEALR